MCQLDLQKRRDRCEAPIARGLDKAKKASPLEDKRKIRLGRRSPPCAWTLLTHPSYRRALELEDEDIVRFTKQGGQEGE